MKITFLGTAGDAIVCGTQERASGGIVISGKEFQFLINPGPGCLVRAKENGVNLRNTSAVLVTSSDLVKNHDLNAVILAMTHGGLDAHGKLYVAAEAYDPRNRYHSWLDVVTKLTKKEFYKDYEIVTVLGKESGIKMYLDNVIGIAGRQNDNQEFKGCDVLILGPEDASAVIKSAKPRLAVLSYFGIKHLKTEEIAKQVQARTRVKTIAAHDGLVIDLEDKGQKHLDTFMRK